MVVPTLLDGDVKLFQSLAILEYLEEKYPNPPLLPPIRRRAPGRAASRWINIADSHPLLVPRVRHYLVDDLKLSQEQMVGWIQHWLAAGLQAMEDLLAEHRESGRFCHGDAPSFADIGLVTQVTPARTFNADLTPYKRIMRIYETCMAIPAFADAAPAKQARCRVVDRRGVGGARCSPTYALQHPSGDGTEYGRWRRVSRQHRHGLTVISRYKAPPHKAGRSPVRPPRLGEDVYIMEGANGRVVTGPGTFMFNAPGAVHGGIRVI